MDYVAGRQDMLDKMCKLLGKAESVASTPEAGAARVRPPYGAIVGIKAYRTSWMRGFRTTMTERLSDAEETAANSEPGTALMLVDDARRAAAARDTEYGGQIETPRQSRVRHHKVAAEAGSAAAQRVDLGQTGVRGRRAIGR